MELFNGFKGHNARSIFSRKFVFTSSRSPQQTLCKSDFYDLFASFTKVFFVFTFSGNMCVRRLFVRDTRKPDVKKLKAVFLAFFDYILDSPIYNRGQRVNPNPDFRLQFKRRRFCKRAVLFTAIRTFNRFCGISHDDNSSNRDYG